MRDTRTNLHRAWRPMRRRLRLRFAGAQKFAVLLFFLLLQVGAYLLYVIFGASPATPYSTRGPSVDADGNQIIFNGESIPVDSNALGGMTTSTRTYTPRQLKQAYRNTDIIYTFVNGSEPNHAFRRTVINGCIKFVKHAERQMYYGKKAHLACHPSRLVSSAVTNGDVLRAMGRFRHASMLSSRDRERDELKYSIRSVEKHMRWHRGRLLIVSPGHHPFWVDAAKNFLSGALRSDKKAAGRGRHTRIITVHQDAVMPYGMRLTVDSHVIEQYLFRVRKTTPIHIFMNDDYFINRDTAVTDLLNEYGGTYVRTEGGMLKKAVFAPNGSSWIGGVHHTNLFNVLELDYLPEDHLPSSLVELWKKMGYEYTKTVPVPSGNAMIHAAYNHVPEEKPEKKSPRRPRFFATHAPFVYCTRMFEYLQTRYTSEMASNALHHRSRKANDYFVPFVYNAFIMARPWQTSPQFLPYLAALHESRATQTEAPSPINIKLDNRDACAPATLLRRPASESMYAKFVDEADKNVAMMERLKVINPLFFNINDGFTDENASHQLQNFLSERFPEPSFVERMDVPETAVKADADREGAMAGENHAQEEEQHQREKEEEKKHMQRRKRDDLFDALMQMPLIILASYPEAFCPLVRSVSLALQHFKGPIILSRAIYDDDAEQNMDFALRDDDLAKRRGMLEHRVHSAMPVTKCTFGSNVHMSNILTGKDIPSGVERALNELYGGDALTPEAVPLPSDYIHGSDVRVSAFVIDARISRPPETVEDLTNALQAPAQTLALEDFTPIMLPDTQKSALILSLGEAESQGMHWVNGASEEDLLITFPLPSAEYEDLTAKVKWSTPN